MKQRCGARCDMYVRNSQGESESHAAKASHAAAQEGELHKKSDDARAGGAVPMMPRSYHRERGPPSGLERRLATVRLERSTPCLYTLEA